MKKLMAILLTMIITISFVLHTGEQEAQAAGRYITVSDFAKSMSEELGLTAAEGSGENGYIDCLINIGILKDGDFSDYSKALTRGDLLVLMNRADEYLNGKKLKDSLVKLVIKKRINDIGMVSASKKEDLAKGFMKGFMKGASDGTYTHTRTLKVSNKSLRVDALNILKMLKNKSHRVKMSPDGQVIRTKNLPRNASSYDYILESFPNKFYERQFEFMIDDKWKYPNYVPHFGFPIDMKSKSFINNYYEWPLSEEMDKYLYDWADMAERYLNYIFNVNYRTVDNKWIEGLGDLYTKSNLDMPEMIRKYYIEYMKKNKVIIESSIISVEPSTFYKDRDYCMRAYVRYRITAENISVDQYQLLYSQYPVLKNLKSGEWREGVFDIRFGTNNGSSGDGSDFSIDLMTRFVDKFNTPVK